MSSNINEALSKIQKELKAPKGQFNKFGKYNYRNCEDILEAVKEHLNGLTLTLSDEMVMLGDRFYIKATAELRSDVSSVSVCGWAREAITKKGMDEAQITGAASSYARKYALNGLFCIDDTKDADSMDNTKQAKVEPAAQDLEWVKVIRSGSAKLEEITNVEYRKYIEGLLK